MILCRRVVASLKAASAQTQNKAEMSQDYIEKKNPAFNYVTKSDKKIYLHGETIKDAIPLVYIHGTLMIER